MPDIPEKLALAEHERPAYMDHWTEFANEQIARPDSPIREDEQFRFRTQCAENAVRLHDAREAMLTEQTPDAVNDWYSKLGTTNTLEGAKPDLNKALSILLTSERSAQRDDVTLLLAGNIAQEIGNISTGREAEGFFAVASKSYEAVVRNHNPKLHEKIDTNIPTVRQAMVHSFDTAFARLSQGRRDGLLSQEDFDKQYQARHLEFVQFCHRLAGKDSNIGNGELFEFYGEMVLRHRLWMRELFGEAEVRRAFTLREDRPHDGFRKGGRHVNQQGMLPAYSFDIKLSVLDGSEAPRFVQLKEADGGRYAKPPLEVWKYKLNTPLRKHVQHVSEIMLKSYRFETTDLEENEIAQACLEYEAVGT